MSYLKNFQEEIDKNNYKSFLELWENYCFDKDIKEEEAIQILNLIQSSKLISNFGSHIEKGLLIWEKIEDPEIKNKFLRLILDIQTTNSEKLADIATSFLKVKYSNDVFLDKKLMLVGLKTKDNFQSAITHYELLNHLKKGNFVFHKTGWGTGEILDVSLIREEICLEFEFTIGKKFFSLENAMKHLIKLNDEHFLAQRFKNPDKLELIAKKKPASLIRMILKDLGNKTLQEIKDEVFDLIIPSNDWNKWWQSAKSKAKKDKKILFPKNSKEELKLLQEELAFETQLYEELDSKPSPTQLIDLLYSFTKAFSKQLSQDTNVKNDLIQKIENVLLSPKLVEAQALQLLFILEELKEDKKEQINKLINSLSNPIDISNSIHITGLKKIFLKKIKKIISDWPKIFTNIFLYSPTNDLRDYLMDELIKLDKEAFHVIIHDLIKNPIAHPYLYFWYFKKIIKLQKAELPFSTIDGKSKCFESFLILLAHINDKDNYSELTKKMIALIISNKFELIRIIFKHSSIEQVKEFILLITKCSKMNSYDIQVIKSLSYVIYPNLNKEKRKPEKKEIIFATPHSFKKMKEKIQYIATIEILDNAKEIEEARAHGDLKENAEYKSSLEKRQYLQNTLQLLTNQLSIAKILTKEEIDITKIGIGTKVKCKNEAGDLLEFTILDLWDADSDNNIFSINSEFVKNMQGLKVSDTFKFQDKTYKILKISNYFE